MSDSPTYRELIEAGPEGDRALNVKLTVRQLCALEFVLDMAISHGIGQLVMTGVAGAFGQELSERMRIEFARAQARLGIELHRAFENDEHVLEFTARLAELDGEATSLD